MNVDSLIAQLRIDEGEVLHAYKDSEGYWTIGVGRLIDERRGGGISRDESDYLLRNDVRRVVATLDRLIPWWSGLSEERQLVLANMAFNLGAVRFVSNWPNLMRQVREGRYEDAARNMESSRWATQVGDRATRLVAKMRGPKT